MGRHTHWQAKAVPLPMILLQKQGGGRGGGRHGGCLQLSKEGFSGPFWLPTCRPGRELERKQAVGVSTGQGYA